MSISFFRTLWGPKRNTAALAIELSHTEGRITALEYQVADSYDQMDRLKADLKANREARESLFAQITQLKNRQQQLETLLNG